jgi:hypothetical protein
VTTTEQCTFDVPGRVLTCIISQRSTAQTCTVDLRTDIFFASVADFVDAPIGTTRAQRLVGSFAPMASS